MTKNEILAARGRSVERLLMVNQEFEAMTILNPDRDSMSNFFQYISMTEQMTALEKGIAHFDRLLEIIT
jgi:hypothetical protein